MTDTDRYAKALEAGHSVVVTLVANKVLVTDNTTDETLRVELSADRMAMLRDTILTAMRREEAGAFS